MALFAVSVLLVTPRPQVRPWLTGVGIILIIHAGHQWHTFSPQMCFVSLLPPVLLSLLYKRINLGPKQTNATFY
uniref:Putative secreted protein n=1 Tax=Anopheles triannulatus TaxID=58253 RepID=A0A2M4B3B9_9DIPT